MSALRHGATCTSSAALDRRQFKAVRTNPTKPVLFVSSFSASFTTKRTARKNQLRQKFLKTLGKPLVPKLPPENLIYPNDQEIKESRTTLEIDESSGNEEVQKFVELRENEGSVPSAVGVTGNVGVLANNSILKYGLWLVGAFVVQTVCVVWYFGSSGIDDESDILKGSGESRVRVVLNGNGSGKMGLKNSAIGSFGYVDELEMERKIEEIRVMAREAREKERLESKRDDLDSEDDSEEESDGGKFRSGIEEEVDNRLDMLRKKLGNAQLKMPVVSVGYLGKDSEKRRDAVEKGKSDVRESNEALLFKKYKFRGLSGNEAMEKPKGFGSDDRRVKNGYVEKENELSSNENGDNGEKHIELSDVDEKGIDALHLVEEDSKKERSEMTESTSKKVATRRGTSNKGTSKTKDIDVEKDNGKSAVGPRKLNGEAMKSRRPSTPDNPSKGNKTLSGESHGDAKSSEYWWLILPYALAIVMRRGDDGEGGEGLYTLRSISSREDQISHMVAFEDHADATNFCSLLQSFFEELELEDFKAYVVPLTIKELNEALKLFNDKVLVVRRGQLKLYAGQALTEAETALRSMIQLNVKG